MGDKSPKSNDRNKKQAAAAKNQKAAVAAGRVAKQQTPVPAAKKK